jgi:putative endonuclease
MKWTVYALKSVFRNYIYVGLSSVVKRRIRQHNEGKEKTTRPYRPFKLILLERFETRAEARRREVYLKSGSGKEFLKRISAETRDGDMPEE